jgi:hypothetical protein
MNYADGMYETFLYFIKERESVRIKKETGKPMPWTNDPIIAEWRFCNVNRCHDRETIWIFKNIASRHIDSLWFFLALARFVNWRETLAELLPMTEWDPKFFKKVMRERGERGEKVWTGAYLVPSGPTGVARHDFLADQLFTPMWEKRNLAPTNARTCAEWSGFFRTFVGMGDFMRNQIITDMKYTWHLPPSVVEDWHTFCLAGPGTMRGLNRIEGRPVNTSWRRPDNANVVLQSVRRSLRESLGERDPIFEHMHDLNNLSNCFCEFDKYMRVKNGEGKPRSRYVPTEV